MASCGEDRKSTATVNRSDATTNHAQSIFITIMLQNIGRNTQENWIIK